MNIIVSYDPSVTPGKFTNFAADGYTSEVAEENAFKKAITYVVDLYDSLFTNNVSFTIDVGWGEYNEQTPTNPNGQKNGTPIPTNALAANYQLYASPESYTQVVSALKGDEGGLQSEASVYAALPGANPLPSGNYAVTLEQAEALAPSTFTSAGSGDNVGFGTAPNGGSWYFGTGTPGSNQTDFIGVAEHEISEGMGRVAEVNTSGSETVLDLFRYSSPGVRDVSAVASGSTNTAYFSTNGGVTSGGTFNNDVIYTNFPPPTTSSPYDLGDWAPGGGTGSGGVDSFGNGNSGVVLPLTVDDLAVMNAIGWNLSFDSKTVPGGVTDYVSSGQTISGMRVLEGGYIEVGFGGTAIDTTVSSGGTFIVDGVAKGLTQDKGGVVIVGAQSGAASGGELDILSGDAATGVVISGGTVNLRSGGTADNTIVTVDSSFLPGQFNIAGSASGTTVSASADVLSGGTADDTTVKDVGELEVSFGGTASGTVDDGGLVDVSGRAVATTLRGSGGQQEVEAGGTATGTIVSSGSTEELHGGGDQGSIISRGGQELVDSGGTATDAVDSGGAVLVFGGAVHTTLRNGGAQTVEGGGTASDTHVSSGGREVLEGGADTGSIISSGGQEIISAGGIATNTTILDGGIESVDSGTAESPHVDAGGKLFVFSNGQVFNADVAGSAYIAGGAAAASTLIEAGGTETVSGFDFQAKVAGTQVVDVGGVATEATVEVGGTQLVSGGVTSDTIIAGGHETVARHGTAINSLVGSGGFEFIQSGGTATGTVDENGGADVVESGGKTSGTIILSGGTEDIGFFFLFEFAGGTAVGTTIASGGTQDVLTGTALDTLIANGGNEVVFGGGVASSTTVSSGGLEVVDGKSVGAFILNGGTQQVSSGGLATGNTIESGGLVEIFSGGTASSTIESGGTVEIFSGSHRSDKFEPGAILEIGSGNTVSNGAIVPDTVLEVASGAAANAIGVTDGAVEVVDSGGTASGTVVSSGGTLELLGGAIANGTTIEAGGTLEIASGYSLTSYNVTKSTTLEVAAGGIAAGTIVSDGGVEIVDAGGTDSNPIVSAGGMLTIFGSVGGLTADPGSMVVVSNGGTLEVLPGNAVSGVAVDSNGVEIVDAGATVNGTIINDGGFEIIFSGGTASNTIVDSGGTEVVGFALFGGTGGLAVGTIVSSGGTQDLFGGTSSKTVLRQGDQFVLNGGTASGTIISSGGLEVVSAGGTTIGTVVSGGGTLELLGGATDGGTTIKTGGTLEIASGYSLSDYVVKSGITLEVAAGGIAAGTIVLSGGTEVVETGGSDSNPTVSKGGLLTIYGTVSGITVSSGGNVVVSAGGTLEVTGTTANSGTITMAGNAAIVATAPSATLTNYNTIMGGGEVGAGDNALTLDNFGRIWADGATLTLNTGANTITNESSAVLGSESGGILEIDSNVTQASASSQIRANAGSQTFINNATVTGGQIDARAAGAQVILNNTTLINASLDTGGTTGVITTAPVASLFDAGPVLDGGVNTADLVVAAGTKLSLEGTINNDQYWANSQIYVNEAILLIAGSVTLDASGGNGVVSLSSSSTNAIEGAGTGASLTNVNNTISGSGQIGLVDGTLALDNEAGGTIDGGALAINTGGATVDNAGILEAPNFGELQITDGVDNAASGNGIFADGGDVLILGAVTGGGNATIANAGTLEFGAGSNAVVRFLNGTGDTGTLAFDAATSTNIQGTVAGFAGTAFDTAHSDTIDLRNIIDAMASFTWTQSNSSQGVLAVTDGTHSADLTILGQYAQSDFNLSAEPRGGTGTLVLTKNSSNPFV
jgi:autotransporter passenger strand-loop-strand repeat protein